MKYLSVLLVLMPIVFAAPQKKFILDTLIGKNGTGGILSLDALKKDLQVMLDTIGSDPTEQQCEQEGHKLIQSGILTHSIPLICHSFQELVQHFHIVTDATTVANKRFLLDDAVNVVLSLFGGLVSVDALKQDLQTMVDVLGSDPSEAACEQEGARLLGQGPLQHVVPIVCHSFQTLLGHFHIVPVTTSA